MNISVFCFIIAVLVSEPLLAFSEEAIIMLKDFVVLNKTNRVLVGDISELSCSSQYKSFCEKLAQIPVEYSGQFISKYNVIKALAGFKNFKIIGRVTKILHNNPQLVKQRLTEAIKAYVISVCKDMHPEVAVDLLNFKEEEMEKELKIKNDSWNCISGKTLFNVNDNLYVSAEINISGQTVKAVKDISKYEQISAQNVFVEKRRIDTPNLINNVDSIVGLRTRCFIKANSSINVNCLEVKPLINSGDIVTLRIRGENIELSSPAKAMQNGKQGELIGFRNMVTNKIMQARVVSKDKAEVNL